MSKIMTIFGTRPEAIKMAPVIKLLGDEALVVSTGQHKEMLAQALEVFNIKPDIELSVMEPNQSLDSTAVKILDRLSALVKLNRPDYILVQGDTTTAFCGALCGFYNGIRVGHIEAGLRTYDTDPYPEEAHRRMITMVATDHFAPTFQAACNLTKDKINPRNIIVTGNTIVDAILSMPKERIIEGDYCLVTCHRRENFKYLDEICNDIAKLSEVIHIIMPVHPNPNVRDKVHKLLGANRNITLTEPVCYQEMVNLMYGAKLIVSDSGGIQEEAASLNKMVLVMRDSTERPEGIEAGCAKLVGTRFYSEACRTLSDTGQRSITNPYGDGHAAEYIVGHIRSVTR